MMTESISFHQVTNPYFRFIHPLKQREVESIFKILPQSVEELWVFGSSITLNHYPWSDLDIFIIGNLSEQDKIAILDSVSTNIDLIVDNQENFCKYSKQFGHCYYLILNKGIKYFDRRWLSEWYVKISRS